MFDTNLLPCGRCSTWATRVGLCVGCGAARAPGLVSLDCTPGDGRWVQVHRGASERVAQALAVPVGLPDAAEAAARVAAAKTVLKSLRGEVSLAIDLRSAESGHVARVKRRGSSIESFYVLPWLIVRSSETEVRLIRHAHRKVQRSFGERVNTQASEFELDLIWARTGGRTLRRPLRSLAGFRQAHLAGGSAEAPGWERSLPPTAPGVGAGAGQASLAQGLALAVVLFLLAPLALFRVGEPDPGTLPSTLELPRLGPVGVRLAAQQRDRWSRRKALVAATSLAAAERWRLLRATAVDPGADLDVRLQAVELLSGSQLGATTLVDLERRLSATSARWSGRLKGAQGSPRDGVLLRQALADAEGVRLQVLRQLASRSDPRAVLIARGRLRAGGAPGLRRAWAQALGAAPRGDPGTVQQLLECLQDSDPEVRGQAGWSLAQVAASGIEEPLLTALRRTALERRSSRGLNGGELALLNLSRALAAAGLSDALRREALTLSLSARVQGEIAWLTSSTR